VIIATLYLWRGEVTFDTNGSMEHGYWLGFERSRRDLESLGDELRNGTRVTIYAGRA
jgi:hypothetical protein